MNNNLMSIEEYLATINKAKQAEKDRPKTGDKYELRILDGESEKVYLQGEDIDVEEGVNWKWNGYKLYGNQGILSGFYYGSGTCNETIGTVLEIEYGYSTKKIEFGGKEIEVSDNDKFNMIKQNKTIRLYKNNKMIDEVLLDYHTEYVDGAIDKEIRPQNHIISCINLKELYRFPSWVDPDNPFHRIVPYEISSVSFSI